MQRFQENGIEWLEFDLLTDIPDLTHAVFLRHGGRSQGPFHSLNIGDNLGDHPHHVEMNRGLIQNCLENHSQASLKLKRAKQCHGKQVKVVDFQSPQESDDCDALITSTPGISLLIRHADCQAAIFYDPQHHVIANVHCGWRGNVLNIYQETVQRLKEKFGSRPENLLVGISPSLGPDDLEFIDYNQELPEEFWNFQTKSAYFDFWAISEHQLQAIGLLPHHIEIARLSTYSNPHDYFSYRRQQVTGRHATCAALLGA